MIMNKRVLQICSDCATYNGAEWKNPKNSAPLMLSACDCCGIIKPVVHINFWKGITSDGKLKPFKAKTVKDQTKKVSKDVKDQAVKVEDDKK